MAVGGRPQQQRRRVHRAARHHDQARPRRDAPRRRVRPRPPITRVPDGVGDRDGGASAARPQRRRSACASAGVDAAHLGVALGAAAGTGTSCRCCRARSRRHRPGRAGRAAAATDAGPWPRRLVDDRLPPPAHAAPADAGTARAADRWGRRRASPRTPIERLGAVVVRRQRVVVDRPGRRHAVDDARSSPKSSRRRR